jgi:hypothetical protein
MTDKKDLDNVSSESVLRDAAEDQLGKSPDVLHELKDLTPEKRSSTNSGSIRLSWRLKIPNRRPHFNNNSNPNKFPLELIKDSYKL